MPRDKECVARTVIAMIRERGGKPRTAKHRRAAMIALTAESLRRNPQGGRSAAVTEATAVLGKITSADGRPKLSKPQRKAVKRAAKESVLRARVEAEVRETLTAAQTPQPP